MRVRLPRAVVVALVAVLAVGCGAPVTESLGAGFAGSRLSVNGHSAVGGLLAGRSAAGKRRLSGRSGLAEQPVMGTGTLSSDADSAHRVRRQAVDDVPDARLFIPRWSDLDRAHQD
jgi:hypothetical protein